MFINSCLSTVAIQFVDFVSRNKFHETCSSYDFRSCEKKTFKNSTVSNNSKISLAKQNFVKNPIYTWWRANGTDTFRTLRLMSWYNFVTDSAHQPQTVPNSAKCKENPAARTNWWREGICVPSSCWVHGVHSAHLFNGVRGDSLCTLYTKVRRFQHLGM